MNRFYFVLLLAISALTLSAQESSSRSSIMFRQHTLPASFSPDVAMLSTIQPQVLESYQAEEYTSISLKEGGEGYTRKGRYASLKKKRNTGIVLTAVGLPFLVGGTALAAYGFAGLVDDVNNANGNTTGTGLLGHYFAAYAGVIFGAAGLGMTIPGAILWARGAKQMKNFKQSDAK